MRHLLSYGLVALLGTATFAQLSMEVAPSFAQLSRETAPTGSYKAVLGTSVGSKRAISSRGIRNRTRRTEIVSGNNIQISITSYSPKSELEASAQASYSNLATMISGFNHGSVTIDGQSYPINLATSFRSGDNYRINLVSSKPYNQTGTQGIVGKGVAVGHITLLVPVAGGQGTGNLYTSTGVTVSASGDVRPSAGRISASATQLTAVMRDS